MIRAHETPEEQAAWLRKEAADLRAGYVPSDLYREGQCGSHELSEVMSRRADWLEKLATEIDAAAPEGSSK